MRRYLMLAPAVLALASGCGKDKSDDGDSKGDDTKEVGEVAVDTNPAAAAYPDGLTVTGFSTTDDTQSTSTVQSGTVAIEYSDTGLRGEPNMSLAAVKPALALLQAGPAPSCFNSIEEAEKHYGDTRGTQRPPPPPPREARAEARDRINGKTECFTPELYATLKDMMDAIKDSVKDLDGYGDCFVPDWGMVHGFYQDSKGAATKDVCSVGYGRNELSELNTYVEFGKGLTEAMLCQALKDGTIKEEIPAGGSVDLTAALAKAPGDDKGKFEGKSAKLTRQAGDSLGYLTEVVVSLSPPKSNDPNELQAFDLALAIDHRPTDATNTAYTGKFRVSLPGRMKSEGKDIASTFALSLDYSRSTDSVGDRIKYELRSGSFKEGKSPFDADGVVDFNVYGKDVANESVQKMNLISYDGYPEIDVAKMSYWVNFGGRYEEAARGMIFDVKRADGKVKGCAVAGATSADHGTGTSIRSSIAEGYALVPAGYSKPRLCDGAGSKEGTTMWLQCFYRDDSGNFVVDADLIKDKAAGFDVVEGSVIEEKVPTLVDVPRPPRYASAKFQPPPGAPRGPHMPPPPGPQQ